MARAQKFSKAKLPHIDAVENISGLTFFLDENPVVGGWHMTRGELTVNTTGGKTFIIRDDDEVGYVVEKIKELMGVIDSIKATIDGLDDAGVLILKRLLEEDDRFNDKEEEHWNSSSQYC